LSEYLTVAPGVNLTRHLAEHTPNGRVTKAWVRLAMQQHPEWDWRNLGPGGTYVNGQDCIRQDLTLQVVDPASPGTVKAMVNFQINVTKPIGYQAVVL
jgi:hypothetical protein